MSMQPTQDIRPILTRLDSIMRELVILRQQLTTPPPEPTNLTDKLFGVLGVGSWDEYELDLDWQRFAL